MFTVQVSPASFWENGDTPKETPELSEETDCHRRREPCVQNAGGGPELGYITLERGVFFKRCRACTFTPPFPTQGSEGTLGPWHYLVICG